MNSQRKPTVVNSERSKTSARDLETDVVEIDAVFARTIGLQDGQKVILG